MLFNVLSSRPRFEQRYRNQFILVHDNWDDSFRFATLYQLYFIDDNANYVTIGDVKIGQLNMQENQRQPNLPGNFVMLPDNFFSLGQSDYYYENLGNLGDKMRELALQALHDVSYDLELYDRVKELDVMRISLMRSVSEFEIRNQLHRIAQGSARLTDYWIEYTYPSVEGNSPIKLTFEVEPESNPPTNIQVLIGRNNVGKTYFIQNFIRAVYGNLDAGNVKSSSTGMDKNWAHFDGQAFANILTISFSPFDDYKLLGESIPTRLTLPYLHIGLKDGNLQEEITNIFLKGLYSCQGLLHKVKLLGKAIEILETDPVFEREKIHELLFHVSQNSQESQEIARRRFKRLSSGHQVILLTLTCLVDKITEKSLVILDEPENHLHPPLLSAFIRALSELLIDRNNKYNKDNKFFIFISIRAREGGERGWAQVRCGSIQKLSFLCFRFLIPILCNSPTSFQHVQVNLVGRNDRCVVRFNLFLPLNKTVGL